MLLNHPLTAGVTGLVLLVTTSVIAAEKKPGEKWAVLVGVDDYAYVKHLQFCVADMRSLKTELLHAGFDERQVILLDDEAKEKKLLPFRSNIEKQIELVCANAEKGDFVLIAFSGHGVLLGKTSFLCPSDARVDDAKTLISLDWVYQQLQRSHADLRLVLVDACRNVPVEMSEKRSFTEAERKDNTRAFVEQAERLPEGVALLNSCSEGEFATEDKEIGHGVFMHFLLEGLRGKADKDGDKSVTLDELIRFTSKETKLYVGAKFGTSQRPKLKSDLTGEALDYQVAVIGSPRPTVPTRPSDPTTNTDVEKLVTSRSTGMTLGLIPAGTFMMGSSLKEKGNDKNENPQHSVQITRPFYMGVYEVTQGEFEKVMGTNPSYFSSTGEGSGQTGILNTRRFPVERVSWYDAIEFCNTLSEQDGLSSCYKLTDVQRVGSHSIESAGVSVTGGNGYRLPTEAEWEYACRGTTTTPFNFGSELNGDDANVNGDFPYGTTTKGKFLARTTTVGLYKPNRFGLHDIHGNVYEWCFDIFDGNAYRIRNGTTKDPVVTSTLAESLVGTAHKSLRVLRGGCWNASAQDARSACRGRFSPDVRHHNLGFRVVR